MSTSTLPSNVVHLKIVSNTESPDKFLSDESLLVDFIDLINRNFVLEVEASHALKERGSLSSTNPAIKQLKCVSEEGIIQNWESASQSPKLPSEFNWGKRRMIVKDGPMRAIVGIREAQARGVSNETIMQWHPNRVPPETLIIFCRAVGVFHEDSTNMKFILKLENELKKLREK